MVAAFQLPSGPWRQTPPLGYQPRVLPIETDRLGDDGDPFRADPDRPDGPCTLVDGIRE